MQSTILAPGTTAATSTDVTVAAGAVAVVGIFKETEGADEAIVHFRVKQDTPGADSPVAVLDNWNRSASLTGPGVFRVERVAFDGTPMGVFLEA